MREMMYGYPKFRFSGLVEFTYRDYSTEYTSHGSGRESGWSSFEQRYALGVKGYVYHPKLLTYAGNISYLKGKADYEQGGRSDAKNTSYYYAVSVLKPLPISLDVYGSRIDSTSEVSGSAPYDYVANSFGARFYIAMKKFPTATIEYDHWDYTIERERVFLVKPEEEETEDFFFYDYEEEESTREVYEKKRVREKTSLNRYRLNIKGLLKGINTHYFVTGSLSDYSSPYRNYDGKSLTINTNTAIRKNRLFTSFQYYDIDFMQQTMFSATAVLAPIGRFSHWYKYELFKSDADRTRAESHAFSNFLMYRFSNRFFATARFYYKFGERNSEDEDLRKAELDIHYRKTWREYDLTSYYQFSYHDKEYKGNYTILQNSVGMGMSTKKFKIGKVYANYDVSLVNYDYAFDIRDSAQERSKIAQIDSLRHRFRIGVNRRLPRRAYVNVEFETIIMDSEAKDHQRIFWLHGEPYAEKIRHYTFKGDAGYPLGPRGFATIAASYTTGQTNDRDVDYYYYEGRLNYRLLRYLQAVAWWREDWRNRGWWAGSRYFAPITARAYGFKSHEYQVAMYFSLRKSRLSLEYNARRTEEGPYETRYRLLYLRFTKEF